MDFKECAVSELDLFNGPLFQSQILKSEQVTHHPINSLTNCSTIEFESNGSGNSYRDLSNIFLHLKIKIVKPDGTSIIESTPTGSTTKVNEIAKQPGFINNVLHSIFRNVTVYMNGKIVSNLDFYNLKAYIDTITNYSANACTTQFETCGFYKDTAKHIDNAGTSNAGFVKRKTFTNDGAVYDLCGRVNVDVFNHNRLLPNNINLKIVFSLDNHAFFLLESTEYNAVTEIVEAELFIRHVTVNPSVMLSHHQLLQKGHKFKIPFRRSVVKTHTIAAQIQNTIIDNLFQGVLPKSIIFAMFDNTAFTNRKKSPFNFQHFDLSYFGVHVNGQAIPFQPITMDFDQKNCSVAYTEFLKNLNIYGKDVGLIIDQTDYMNGFFMMAINFSSMAGDCVDLLEDGSIKFELKFEKPLSRAVTTMFYAEYENMLEIDKNMNVSTLL